MQYDKALSDHHAQRATDSNNVQYLIWNIMKKCKKHQDATNNGFGIHEDVEQTNAVSGAALENQPSQYHERLLRITEQLWQYSKAHPDLEFILLQELPNTKKDRDFWNPQLEKFKAKFAIQYPKFGDQRPNMVMYNKTHYELDKQRTRDFAFKMTQIFGVTGVVLKDTRTNRLRLIVSYHAKFGVPLEKDLQKVHAFACQQGIKDILIAGDFNRDLLTDNVTKNLPPEFHYHHAGKGSYSYDLKRNQQNPPQARDGFMSTSPLSQVEMVSQINQRQEVRYTPQQVKVKLGPGAKKATTPQTSPRRRSPRGAGELETPRHRVMRSAEKRDTPLLRNGTELSPPPSMHSAAEPHAPTEKAKPKHKSKVMQWDEMPKALQVFLGFVVALTFPISLLPFLLTIRYQRRHAISQVGVNAEQLGVNWEQPKSEQFAARLQTTSMPATVSSAEQMQPSLTVR